MLLWPKLGYMTRTPFVVMGGFLGGLNGSGSHRKTFLVSGHAHCVGRNGCGPQKNRCFRCGNPKHHDPVSPGPAIGPTGRAPRHESDLPARWSPE